MKKRWLILLVLFSGMSLPVHTQITDVTLELQAYPTGIIPGVRIERGFSGQHAVHLRLGYQFIDHRDLGVQDDEKGQGLGFSLGYKRYFRPEFRGWFLGAKSDIWWNQIDWTQRPGTITEVKGTADIVVLQPTLEGGYNFLLGNNWVLSPSVAFGWELNVVTNGREVGQGSIILAGILIGKRF